MNSAAIGDHLQACAAVLKHRLAGQRRAGEHFQCGAFDFVHDLLETCAPLYRDPTSRVHGERFSEMLSEILTVVP